MSENEKVKIKKFKATWIYKPMSKPSCTIYLKLFVEYEILKLTEVQVWDLDFQQNLYIFSSFQTVSLQTWQKSPT